MSWRFHGHASVDPTAPSAFAVCDRCGLLYNLSQLIFQWEWAGTRLYNKRILVCTRTCLDVPQEQLRAKILSADPVPKRNPRPENYAAETGPPPDPPFNPLDILND